MLKVSLKEKVRENIENNTCLGLSTTYSGLTRKISE